MEEQQTGQIVDIGANQFPKSAQNENDAERLATFKASQSFIRVYFGEFHLICIAHVQTQLLLWRATAWQLHELLGFSREAQLPYFTAVPDSQISGELEQLVDEIVNFGFIPNDQQIREIKNAITGVLKADTSAVLLERVIALGPLLADGWRRLLDAARAKSGRYKEKQVILLVLDSLRNQVTGEPEIDLKQRVAEMMEKYEAAEHDIDSIFQNPRLNISSTRSWFLFCPNHASAPVQLPGFQIDHSSDFVELKWIRTELDETFLRSASTMAGRYRQNPEPFSTHDRLAFHTAYYLLSQGQNEFDRYESRFLGTVGFREQHHQTYLSLTDPGQGHVFGTTTKNNWMSGVTVHVEHLERPARSGMDAIESYRMPSVLEFARVRLHAGSAAPTTAFVGRPLRDSTEFKWDFIKVVDTVSSACSSMFNLGAAECKIGMSRLNASEMIAYMRALRGHTLKNHRQYLSAAFNLNTPLIDDIESKYLHERMDIGVRAIELAALGGFEKVTWDGASDTYPSVPMLQATPNDKGQLSYAQAITLVHLAHSVGLTTYFSAGFKVAHIPATVYSGVDGVGIGGAQVIRAMDRTTGMHGEYQESRIEKLIDERDKAAKSPRGRGAKLLARLDQMFFEGSINTHELKLRKNLFSSLTADMIDEQKLQAMLDDPAVQATWEIDSSKAHDGLVSQERGDGERPWKGRALRLIHQRYDLQPLLRRHGGERSVDGDEQSAEVPGHEWNQFIASLQHTIEGDGDLHSLHMSKPWKTMRHNYQAWVRHMYKDLPKYFMGEIEASLKTTPYGDRSWNQVNNVV